MGKKLSAAARGETAAKGKAKPKPKPGPGKGNFAALRMAGVDLLSEMESVLKDPDQKCPSNPIRHNYLRMLRKDLPEFTRQYNELLKSKRAAGGETSREATQVPGNRPEQEASASLSEEEIRIEEAIERVVEELTAARKRVESG